ncbi:MAG: hypothetical protein AAGF10_08050, partial [Verrucomicrobiota bacterium]
MPKATAKLLYASSEACADALYLAGFFIPDPVILMEIQGKRLGVFSRLEFGRAEKESSLDILIAHDELVAEAKKRLGLKRPGPTELIRLLAMEYQLTRLTVPQDFPYGLAAAL